MGQVLFNTHDAVSALTEAGMSEKQAAAVVRIVDQKMNEFVTEKYLDLKLDSVRLEIKKDLAELENRMFVRMAGLIVTALTLGLAIAKLLF